MRRYEPIVALGTLFVVQLTALAYAQALSGDNSTAHVVVFTTIVTISCIIDIGYARYVLLFLIRQEAAYEETISSQLEESLEQYHVAAAHERDATQELGRTIEKELALARSALASGNTQGADEHLRSSLELASAAQTTICENPVVAAVLASKARQCEDAGVTLHTEVSLPNELPYDDTELASVFFNLIDNALHECEALAACDVLTSEPDAPTSFVIRVRARTQAGQFFVEVSNPCRSNAISRREAAARNADMTLFHGLGTGIVTDIAQKYGGIAEFAEEAGNFAARVMIPLST